MGWRRLHFQGDGANNSPGMELKAFIAQVAVGGICPNSCLTAIKCTGAGAEKTWGTGRAKLNIIVPRTQNVVCRKETEMGMELSSLQILQKAPP